MLLGAEAAVSVPPPEVEAVVSVPPPELEKLESLEPPQEVKRVTVKREISIFVIIWDARNGYLLFMKFELLRQPVFTPANGHSNNDELVSPIGRVAFWQPASTQFLMFVTDSRGI